MRPGIVIQSRARLDVAERCGTTRLRAMGAGPPQRWTPAASDAGGRLRVAHQFVGDGIFGGDRHTTAILVRPGASLEVFSPAATALRGPGRSLHLVRASVAAGGLLVYRPGAIIPHRDSVHTSALRVNVALGGSALMTTILTTGRAGHGERGRFQALRQRTVVLHGGELVLAEDVSLEPDHISIDSLGLFGESAAALSVTGVGVQPPADIVDRLRACEGRGGLTRLRGDGWTVRALFSSLGVAAMCAAELGRDG